MKKYVITGSVGHISKPIIEGLVRAGKEVTVITSNTDKVKAIESLNAKALVGSLFDQAFVTNAFNGADVVYTMIPPIWRTDNWRASQNEIASTYTEAIKATNIKYVVNLSSIGAHLGEGCGPVNAVADFEKSLDKISGLNVKHLRPSSFYYNLLSQIPMLKHAGILGANYGESKLALVHTNDIAAAALEELVTLTFKGSSVRYIVSDMVTGTEIAEALGTAVGKKIPWVVFTDEQLLKGLIEGGVPATHAPAFVEMGVALRTGKMQEDMERNKPVFGPTKLADFAKEFRAAFNA